MFSIVAFTQRSVDLFDEENFIGIGSTRKVYRIEDVVVKKHLHELGYMQSVNEQNIYNDLLAKDLANNIAPILFVNGKFAVQPFYEALPLQNGETYDLDWKADQRITTDLRQALAEISENLDGFDLKDSGNYGIDSEGKLVLIDYGMTKNLYEDQWVPLAEAEVLPQIYFEHCQVCGQEKELRIYGEADRDRRCAACGKE